MYKKRKFFPYNVPFYYFVLTGKFFSWHPAWWRWWRERTAREKHGNRMRENVILSPSLPLRKLHHWSKIDDSKFTMSPPPSNTHLHFSPTHIVSSSFSSSSMLSFSYIFLFFANENAYFHSFACFLFFIEKYEDFSWGERRKKSLLHSLYLKVFFPYHFTCLISFHLISFQL